MIKKFYFLILTFLFFSYCDTKKTYLDQFLNCNLLGSCPSHSIFGMVGDSWTDFAFGGNVQKDLRDQLVERYKLPLTASNVAGLTLQFEVSVRKGYLDVIRNAGPNLRYILLSLGGNDLQYPITDYSLYGFETTIQKKFSQIREDLKTLISTGNYYKIQLYGGEPLIWFIHGYDYPDPIKDPSCIEDIILMGISRQDAEKLIPEIIDRYNQFLIQLTGEIPYLYYIDLRRTLGGPPFSNSLLMFDCIHPNSAGFSLLSDKYIYYLKMYISF